MGSGRANPIVHPRIEGIASTYDGRLFYVADEDEGLLYGSPIS